MNLVKRVVPVLISKGKFEHPWVGISGVTLTSDLAQAMGLPFDQRGALIVDVTSGSPADEAGLRGPTRKVRVLGMTEEIGGDVIVAVDGHPVTKMDDLLVYLEEHKSPGDTIDLTVLRDGKEKHISLTLGKRPKELP